MFPLKANLNRAFWAITLGLTAHAIYLYVPRAVRAQTIHSTSVRPLPHMVTLKSELKDPKGVVSKVLYYTSAVRSDGSTALKVIDGQDVSRFLEFSSKTHAIVKEFFESRSIEATSRTPFIRDPNRSCVATESVIGEESVGLYRAVKVTKGGRTSWYSLEYGCALLREVWNHPNGEVSEKTLVSLIAGEPDPSLFHVPESYKEVPPSEIADPVRGPRCVGCTSKFKERLAMRDKYYAENRPAAIPK